jgi:2-polyprenyl-3-methyl-5-hydroxy-6-metoxy-1,4-benzoquinol methylase
MRLLTGCTFCNGNLAMLWKDPPFSRCADCNLVMRNPFPSQQELDALYEASWSDPDANSYETGNMDGRLAAQYVGELLKNLGRERADGLRILDFGAGKGALMAALKNAGAEVYGVEPYGHDRLQEMGKNAYRSLDDVPQSISFDGIISMDVVEHLPRPWETFATLFQRIKPGGWLCISVPNPKGLNARLNGGKWREARKVGHIVFLEGKTLVRMLRWAGFSAAKPVRWNVHYGKGFMHRLSQRLLVIAGLHGAVRVIAYKR